MEVAAIPTKSDTDPNELEKTINTIQSEGGDFS